MRELPRMSFAVFCYYMEQAIGIVWFLFGISSSIAVSVRWSRYVWARFFPYAYALVGELLLSLFQLRLMDWRTILLFGVLFHFIVFLEEYIDRRKKKPSMEA